MSPWQQWGGIRYPSEQIIITLYQGSQFYIDAIAVLCTLKQSLLAFYASGFLISLVSHIYYSVFAVRLLRVLTRIGL